MTDDEMDRLRTLASKADEHTPGHWLVIGEPGNALQVVACGGGFVANCDCPYKPKIVKQTADYIAAADPLTVVALIDEVARLRGLLAGAVRVKPLAWKEWKRLDGFVDAAANDFGIIVEHRLDGWEWAYCVDDDGDEAASFPCGSVLRASGRWSLRIAEPVEGVK